MLCKNVIDKGCFYPDTDKIFRQYTYIVGNSARVIYRLDRHMPRASIFKGPPAKVYTIFNTVIGLSHLHCRNVLCFLSNPSVSFLTQLHSISDYYRILNTHSSSLPILKLIKHASIFLR